MASLLQILLRSYLQQVVLGKLSKFQNGVIIWSAATGAHDLTTAFFQVSEEYIYKSGQSFKISNFPIGSQESTFDGGIMQRFEYGQIYSWPDTGIILHHGAPLTQKPPLTWEGECTIRFDLILYIVESVKKF